MPVHGAGATLSYALITIGFTWPLATGLSHLVPWDLGDSLLNDWILAWHYHQAGRLFTGDWGALTSWWHPPIFHPAPYALGYSELLVTQALLGAPVYAATGNLLLTYNALFLASFVLSGLGTFLLVRAMTGDARAAWVAGLVYAFALYRVTQAPHLQVLHAQWAPFVLWLLHRWLDEGRWRDAVCGGVALAAQGLSNGHYLYYLALILPPYVLVQLVARGRLRDMRAWAGVGITALVALAIVVPCMYPYVQLRAAGHSARPLAAVATYGADTMAWLTANEQVRVWGWLQTRHRPEGDLFPGVMPVALAGLGLWLTLWSRAQAAPPRGAARGLEARLAVARPALSWLAVGLLAWHSVALLLFLFGGLTRVSVGPVGVSISDGGRLLVWWVASAVCLLATSRRARRALVESPHAPAVVVAALVVLTVWLSFGPVIRIGGRPAPSWPPIYGYFYDLVPGADALRVPPRIAMMTTLLLAMLGGMGLAALRARRRVPDLALALVGCIVVAEAWPAPIPVNGPMAVDGLAALPADVPADPRTDPEARALAQLPDTAVLVELPMGSTPWEIRWQYLAAGHWRARLNGYSGGHPVDHLRVEHVFGSLPGRSDEAAALLREKGVTHVVLRPHVWLDAETPEAIRAWLQTLGAQPMARTPQLEVWRLE